MTSRCCVVAAKERGIAIPTDLETQVSKLYSQSQMMARTTKAWRLSSSRPRAEGEQRKRERQSQYKIIIDGLQDIVQVLEDQLRPLVQAELSVLVDVLHRPELLFPPHTDARRKCESGGFICKCVRCVVTSAFRDVMIVMCTFDVCRLIKHTERLIEEKEEKLCIKVLQTLKEMIAVQFEYKDKVATHSLARTCICAPFAPPTHSSLSL